jgi:zinc transport system substrate-binding protein
MADMTRRVILIALAIAVAAIAPSAAAPKVVAPKVVVTVLPVHSLAAMVMQGIGTPGLLLKGGAAPHGYALRPSDARLIGNAEIIFWIGPAFETFLSGPLASLGRGAHITALAAAPGMVAIKTPAGATDMHLWLDPINAQAMVRAMQGALSRTDPANAAAYAANAAAAAARLKALDRELQRRLQPVQGIPYVVFHDAYRYLERRYGLTAIAAVTTGPARPPGARRLRRIRRRMSERGARCIFSEPQFRPALAEALVRDTGARHAVLDPLGAGIAPGRDAYGALLRRLAGALTDCLTRP